MTHESELFVHDNRQLLLDQFDDGILTEQQYRDADFVSHGEGWEGMARHIHNDMNSLDRIIFEECVPSADNTVVMAPHENLSTSPYYLTPRWVISKIRPGKTLTPLRIASQRANSFSASTLSPIDLTLSFRNAQDLLCFWETIGNTRPLVDSYITWINASGIAASLKYFGHLASELSCITTNPDDFLKSLSADPPAPTLHAYHTIGEQDLPDYYDTIPNWFKELLASIENCPTLETIAELGKASYDKDLGQYAGVFWMHYNRRKKALTPRIVPKADLIIATINSTKLRSRLAKIGKRLYELQADPDYIPTTNWNPIWATYKERKTFLTPAAPVQQDFPFPNGFSSPHWAEGDQVGTIDDAYPQNLCD